KRVAALAATAQFADEFLEVRRSYLRVDIFLNRLAIVTNGESPLLQNRDCLVRVRRIIRGNPGSIQDKRPGREFASFHNHTPLRHLTVPAEIPRCHSYILLGECGNS